MNATVLNAINEQINSEFEASYTYLAMAAYCQTKRFTGAAKWLRRRVEGLRAAESDVRLAAGDLRTGVSAEQRVTSRINSLYELCFAEKAFAEMTELQWFLTEQVEEENVATDIVARFNLVKHDAAALLDMDRELGERSTAIAKP